MGSPNSATPSTLRAATLTSSAEADAATISAGADAPAEEVPLDQFLSRYRADVLGIGLRAREPDAELADAEREDEEHERGAGPDATWPASNDVRNAGPAPVILGGITLGCRLAVAGDEGPEHPTSEEDEQSRQECGHREKRGDDSDGGHRPEIAGGVEIGREQGHQAQGNGRRRGEDGRERPAKGNGHRSVPVLVTAQLFAVARNQQQRVIRPDAEQQHRQNALGLEVHRQAGLGEQVDRTGRDIARRHHAEQRDQPQDRASVRDEQDQGHNSRCDEEKQAVHAGERIGDVFLCAGGPGQGGLEADGRALLYLVFDLTCGSLLHLVAPGERKGDEQRLAVAAGDRRRNVAVGCVAGERGPVDRRLRAIGLRQAPLACVDGDGDQLVGFGERRLGALERPRCLGTPREPRHRIVVDGVSELEGQRPCRRDEQKPERENDKLRTLTGRNAYETRHAASLSLSLRRSYYTNV